MNARPSYRYVVLTERDDAHIVALRHDQWQWLRVLAVFASRERAEAYAEVENMMAEDGDGQFVKTEIAAQPDTPDPGTQLKRLLGVSEPTDTAEVVVTLADEILTDLPKLMESHPKGPTVKVIAQWLGAEEHHVRRAVRDLDKYGRALLMQRQDSSASHLVPIGYRAPKLELTRKQAAVLKAMAEAANEHGVCQISNREICAKAGVSQGTIVAMLDALERKRRISLVARGRGTTPTFWRIEDEDCSLISDGALARLGEGAEA